MSRDAARAARAAAQAAAIRLRHGPVAIDVVSGDTASLVWLEEFLANPRLFDGEEAAWYRRRLEEWQEEERCVLTWGNNHNLDKDGRRAD